MRAWRRAEFICDAALRSQRHAQWRLVHQNVRWTALRTSKQCYATHHATRPNGQQSLKVDATVNDSIDTGAIDGLRQLHELLFIAKQRVASASDGTTLKDEPQSRNIAISELLVNYEHDRGINLLHELALKRNGWEDLVWLSRQLLSGTTGPSVSLTQSLDRAVERVSSSYSLRDLTDNPIGHSKVASHTEHKGPQFDGDFRSLLNTAGDDNIQSLHHRVLGTIWSAIGTLTIACVHDSRIAAGSVRAEILEVLALFHHHGYISPSVYSFTSTRRQDGIQQPVVLHLLSSHIIGGLTDAEWRARDRAALADAKAAGRDISSMQLELRGASVRSNLGTVRPELWLELILWSCLHGGWKDAGLEVLGVLSRLQDPHAWTATSWRTNLQQLMPFGNTDATDWDALKLELDTRRGSRADRAGITGINTQRTISSEVITAYIDAFVNNIHVASNDGRVSVDLVQRFQSLQQLLLRSNLTLQNGSWASVIHRMIDQGLFSASRIKDMQDLINLSPAIGKEPSTSSTNVLPPYVFDGNAALLGMLHRALKMQIDAGNINGIDIVLSMIEACANEARQRSIADFFRSQQLRPAQDEYSGQAMFTSNFEGIEYPLFDTQIPLSTIAACIDLYTETGSFDKARSIFLAEQSEGLFLPRRHFSDPAIAAALARLAAALGNDDDLMKLLPGWIRKAEVTREELNVMLDSCLTTGEWRNAAQILLRLRDKYKAEWQSKCLATAGGSLLTGRPLNQGVNVNSDTGSSVSDIGWTVFEAMLGDIDNRFLARRAAHNRSVRLFGTLCVLALVESRFMQILQSSFNVRAFFCPPLDSFNVILKAVLHSQGNKAARELVLRLMNVSFVPDDEGGRGYYRSARPRDFKITAVDGNSLNVRSKLVPSITTIRLIVQHGVQEWQHSVEGENGGGNEEAILSPEKLRTWAEDMLELIPTHDQWDLQGELTNMMEGVQ